MWGTLPVCTSLLRAFQQKRAAGFNVLRFMSSQMASDSSEIIRNGTPWQFRGEGNSSLVLASPSTRTVLRLRKIRASPTKHGHTSMSDHESSLQGIVNYVDHVIRPMLPCSSWIPRMKVLQFPDGSDGLHQLVHETKSDRDLSRLLDEHAVHKEAIYMRDLCFLPEDRADFGENRRKSVTFSVELKPKEGVLPSGKGVHLARQLTSKYQMKQQMKLKDGAIVQANDYDPLDLFSGENARMKKSLHTLVRNPQNNFRIFLDGTVHFDVRSPGMASLTAAAAKVLPASTPDPAETFLTLVLEALKKPWSALVPSDSHAGKHALSEFSILGGLLAAQKACSIDIEPLHPQYLHLCHLFRYQPALRSALGVDGPDYGEAPFWTGEKLDEFDLSSEEQMFLDNCRSYLATSTVKDCSVFLTFQQIAGKPDTSAHANSVPVIQVAPGISYAFFASLVDLDPKPFERIEKHFVESQRLIELSPRLQQ